MDHIPGPRKLVLINSGVYPYAEIELDDSVHLSGRNNSGKTSLLNALQFLYIDDIKLMNFPNSNFQGKTKPFYFKPSGTSTVLIEAQTKWGIRSVGFHGLGAVAGCDWQRFGFDGAYEKDDFIDTESENPRPWDDVKTRLALKNYVELTQPQLRAALRGSGDKSGFRLELVPGGGGYDTFIEVFRQLLTLRKSKPDDLKNLLISVIEPDLISGDERSRGVVSLASVVGEDYTRAFAANQRYERIRVAEKTCQNLFVDHNKLTELQAVMPESLRMIYKEAHARVVDRRRRADAAQQVASDAKETEAEWDTQQQRKKQEIRDHVMALGAEQGRLDDLTILRERLDAEPKALLEQKQRDVRAECAKTRVDLSAFDGAMDGSAELRKRASHLRQGQKACMDTVQRLRELDELGARAAWMDILAEYPQEERDPLLRLLNPALLSLPEGEFGVEIVAPSEFGRLVSIVAAASPDGVYRGHGVRVNLDALPPTMLSLDDPIVRVKEIEKHQAQAEHYDSEIKRLEILAENSRAKENLSETLKTNEQLEISLGKNLSQIEDGEERTKAIPDLRTTIKAMKEELSKLEEASELAERMREEFRAKARRESDLAAALTREVSSLRAEVIGTLEQQAMGLGIDLYPEETAQEGSSMGDEAFAEAQKNLGDQWADSIRLDQSVNRRMEEIEVQLDGMIAGDRDTKIGILRDLIEGLPDQKAQLDAAWQHIAVTAKTSFSNLLRDYDTLNARVGRLNRAMGQFSVSNLSEIQLRLVEVPGKMEILRQFTQEEGLFADGGLAERAKEQVGDWIKQGQVFRIHDLFRVELEVSKDGSKEVYSSLDAESTGTAVTLKVIFLAHLLRDLYRSRTDVRLLIFVDEVDTLDDVNQETIRECSRQLGFILIMASPNPANANRLYFLRPEGKVTYIYPEESLEVIFTDEADLEGENGKSAEAVS